jgi:hypothetical protein
MKGTTRTENLKQPDTAAARIDPSDPIDAGSVGTAIPPMI